MPADHSNGRPLLSMPQTNNPSTNYPVPVLVNCCSPLADTEPGMKVNIIEFLFKIRLILFTLNLNFSLYNALN